MCWFDSSREHSAKREEEIMIWIETLGMTAALTGDRDKALAEYVYLRLVHRPDRPVTSDELDQLEARYVLS